MSFDAFAQRERTGWADDRRADAYIDLFAPISDQLVSHLVAGIAARPGQEALDLCCGHGNVAAALWNAGAKVTGVDFSPAMLARARNRVPEASFVEGDAANLPFEDASFDAVTCNVGFGHLPDPDRVLAEIGRVLRLGGTAAMTSWREPEVSPTLQLVFGAVAAHGDPSLAPPAPDFHIFSRRVAATEALADAGLSNPQFTDIDSAFEFDDPSIFADVFEHATVRAAMLIAAQSPDSRAAIRNTMTEAVRSKFATGNGTWRVPFPAILVTARRA